jgi:simple sugar transport system ATP-binding protein
LGAGRTAVAHSLFGLRPPDSGQVRIDGKPRKIRSVKQAVRMGIALVPGERATQGLVLSHSVGHNAVLTVLDRLSNRWGLLSRRSLYRAMVRMIESTAVGTDSVDVPAETLSGGNQQRLVLAKWLATRPRILILIGPTVGIDIAAKSKVHRIIRTLALDGVSILMISDEVPELLVYCNRVLLMSRGTITHQWDTSSVSETEIRRCLGQA